MTNLEKLEEAIYKSLPRLKEIKVGQRFHSKYYGEIVATKITKHSKDIYSIYGFDIKEGLPRDNYYPRDLTILGQEIALNDVLAFLNEISGNRYCITSDNRLMKQKYIFGHFEEIGLWIVDLSKPLLKDQSQELINYLTELL